MSLGNNSDKVCPQLEVYQLLYAVDTIKPSRSPGGLAAGVGTGEFHFKEDTMAILKEGTKAPDFSLPSTPDQKVKLSEFRGKNVVLVFYPADWSPVCGDQLALYNEVLPMIKKHNAEVIGLSVDGIWCHLEFTKERKYRFPILSDFEPKGATAKLYGAYRDQDGTSERAIFVIDGEGIIRWSYLSPVGVNPGADGILDALESLSKKEKA
jgi:peroxiredoxin